MVSLDSRAGPVVIDFKISNCLSVVKMAKSTSKTVTLLIAREHRVETLV